MADVNKVLERVRKLVALAASDNENEARNSAVLACRLIREHKIVLSVSEGEPVRQPPQSPFATGNPFANAGFGGFEVDPFWDVLMRDLQRKAQARQRTTCSCGRSKSPTAEVCPECMRARHVKCPRCGRPKLALADVCVECEYEKRVAEQHRSYPGRRRRDE